MAPAATMASAMPAFCGRSRPTITSWSPWATPGAKTRCGRDRRRRPRLPRRPARRARPAPRAAPTRPRRRS
ncbi:hypothetical protein C7I55_11735 [Sphingomonas deserti]|uniref:Uncharacterized protein n=1 Tax=Allosphingosinicella deserti TaxID=2116704 RepID=A0A2P7QSI9_9SPHN|nr:hypothetical protein C7I55_11735 [Sphingomonas deserti]